METVIRSYKKYLSESVSQNTMASYLCDLKKYLRDTETDSLDRLKETDKEHIEQYILYLKNSAMADSSIARVVASLKNFFKYCAEEGIVDFETDWDIEPVQTTRKLPDTLSTEQIVKLLEAPEGDGLKSVRDRAILELMYASGARTGEIVALKADDVSLKQERVSLMTGKKRRTVPIGGAAVDALRKYMRTARGKIQNSDKSDVLFLNFNGQPLSRQGIWKIIKKYIEQVGIKGSITAQTIRHSFALHMLENGADKHFVAEMLGYSDVASVKIYTEVMNDKLKRVYKDSHPRA